MDLNDLQSRIEEMEEAVLLYAAKRFGQTELDLAWEMANADCPGGEADFSEFLIYDYKPSHNQKVIGHFISDKGVDADEIKNNREILTMMSESRLSVYEIMSVGNKTFVKDLFTKSDYEVLSEAAVEPGMLAIGRLYPIEGRYFMKVGTNLLDGTLRQPILNGMMTKMRLYEATVGRMDVDVFIRNHPEVIYTFSGVLHEVSQLASEWDDEELMVFEAHYVFKDRKEVLKALLLSGCAKAIDDDGAETVFSLFDDDDGLLAELVVLENTMEVECRSDEELAYTKELIQNLLGGLVVFAKEEVLSLDSFM